MWLETTNRKEAYMELRLTQRLPAPTHSKAQTEAASVNTTVKSFICMADGLYLFFFLGQTCLVTSAQLSLSDVFQCM